MATCSAHGATALQVRWYDGACPPPAGIDGPVHGVLLHETAHDGMRETLSMVEAHDSVLRVWPTNRRRRLPAPYVLDVPACVAAASALRKGDALVVHFRMPSSTRLQTADAIFLSFSGEARDGAARQTLLYRYVDRVDVPGAPQGFVPGCCGSVVATKEGLIVGMHSWGPPTQLLKCRVGGAYHDQPDGHRVRVGGTTERVNLRKLVEQAELTTFEAWKMMTADGLKPNMYEQAISVYAIRDCTQLWGLL